MTLPDTLRGRMDELLNRLSTAALAVGRREVVRRHGDSYMACCPAHDDKNPSLSLTLEPHRILLHCFAGCEPSDVAAAVGMPMEALFDDYRGQPEHRPKILWNGSSRDAEAALAADWREAAYGPLRAVSELDEGPKALPPDLTSFKRLAYPPIDPILGPFASQQINLMFASTGLGKTMFGLRLAYCMAEGLDFIGWSFHGEPRRVLYVDAEMAARMLQERFGGLESERLFLANLPGWWADAGGEAVNLATEAGQDVVSVWAEVLDVDVIILDNFMSLAWKEKTSFSSDEIWTPLRRWCLGHRAAGKCVLIIDHANAGGKVFGTKTKTHIMDLVMLLEALEEEDEDAEDDPFASEIQGRWARFRVEKSRGIAESAPEVNQRDVEIGPVESTWRHREAVDPLVINIRQMRQDGLSIRDIAKDLGMSYSKIQRTLKRHGDL